MTETTLQATDTAAAPDKSLLARAIGIVVSPRETFGLVAARPRAFGMLFFTILATALMTGGFMFTAVGQQAFLDMMERRGTAGPAMDMYQKLAPYMGYITIGQLLIFTPIILLVIAGILLAVFTLLGGGASFKQVFAVVVYSGVISVLGQIVVLPLNYFTGSMTSSTNLGVLFPMLDERSFAALLLGTVDLFRVWLVMVLAIGLAVIYKRRTGPIAVAFFVLYALIAVGYAALFAARS
jgi:Yip1 domain